MLCHHLYLLSSSLGLLLEGELSPHKDSLLRLLYYTLDVREDCPPAERYGEKREKERRNTKEEEKKKERPVHEVDLMHAYEKKKKRKKIDMTMKMALRKGPDEEKRGKNILLFVTTRAQCPGKLQVKAAGLPL